jgi:hypothetical protein
VMKREGGSMKMSRVYVDVWDKLESHERGQFL